MTVYARDEIIEQICDRIADGESLAEILRSEGMPARNTVRKWRQDPEVEALFVAAVRDQADLLAENMLAVARAAYGKSKADIQAARLEVDTLKFLAAQQSPKKWGLRQHIEMSGELDVRSASEADLKKELAELLPKIQELTGVE